MFFRKGISNTNAKCIFLSQEEEILINCQRRYCLDYGGIISCINIQDTHIFLFYKSDTSWYFNLTVIRISGNYILRTSVLVVIERFCKLSGVGGAYHLILMLRELLYRNSLITIKTLNKWNNSKTSWSVQYIRKEYPVAFEDAK